MKYTIQVPAFITLVIEADDATTALDEAAQEIQDAVIEMSCEYNLDERWEDAQVYDEQGELVEECQ